MTSLNVFSVMGCQTGRGHFYEGPADMYVNLISSPYNDLSESRGPQNLLKPLCLYCEVQCSSNVVFQDVKESKRIWDLLLTIMEHFQPAYIVIQHVWSVLIIFTEYFCQDWNKGFYLLQGTFLSFVPPAERERFVRWVCEWVILFSGVKGSKDGQGGLCDGCKNMFKRLIGMTLSLWFDCSSVNS